jgi:hypothetical protein
MSSRLLSSLKRVIDDARNISRRPPPPPPTSSHAEPRSLPKPTAIVPQLLGIGVPIPTAKSLSQAYIRSGLSLKRKTEKFLSSSLNIASPQESAQVYTVYLKQYQQKLHEWEKKIINTSLSQLTQKNTKNSCPSSHPPVVQKQVGSFISKSK